MNVYINDCSGKISVSLRLMQDELGFHGQFTLYTGHRPNSGCDKGGVRALSSVLSGSVWNIGIFDQVS